MIASRRRRNASRSRTLSFVLFISVLVLVPVVSVGGSAAEARPHAATATNDAPGTARIGERDHFKFETFRLNDRLQARVNVANGNLVVRADDLVVRGTGLDLRVTRYYSSLDTDAIGNAGRRWTIAPTRNNLDLSDAGGSVTFRTLSGSLATFSRNGDGSYTTPTGLDATLVRKADSTFELKWHKSGTTFNFDSAGLFTSAVDKNGNRITIAYSSGKPTSITDTQGRVTQIAYFSGLLRSITDSSGRRTTYTQVSGNLTQAAPPSGGSVQGYSYDASSRLTRITAAGTTDVTYDGSGRVASIVRAGSTLSATTSFTYNAGNTVVTDPRGNRTTHYYDGEGRVTKVVDALGKETSTSYTSNSNVAASTSSSGAVTQNSYDGNNKSGPRRITVRFLFELRLHRYTTPTTRPRISIRKGTRRAIPTTTRAT